MVIYLERNQNGSRGAKDKSDLRKMSQTELVWAKSADRRNRIRTRLNQSELITEQTREGIAEGNEYIQLKRSGGK